MAMKAFGILLTATVAFASPNESRRQLQEGPCADLDGDGDTDVSDLLSLLAAFGVDDSGDTDGDGACAAAANGGAGGIAGGGTSTGACATMR